MSLSGRSNVTFDPKVRHFTTVPMILYPPKVSSEHLVDDVGTSVKPSSERPESDYTYQKHRFFIKNRCFLCNKYALFSNTPALFFNTPALFSISFLLKF